LSVSAQKKSKAGFPAKRNARNLRIFEFTQAPANRNRAVLYRAELVLRSKFLRKNQ